MTTTRQEQIDRMVDGELTAQQQRELLIDCEENSRWRELALAYVESQALGCELKQMVSDTTISPMVAQDPVESSAMTPWALAAAVILSLSIGYGGGWWLQSDNPMVATGGASSESVESDARQVASNQAATMPESTSKVPESMQFTVAHPTTNELRQIQLPIVNASELQPGWEERLRPGIPADLDRELQAGGLKMEQSRTVVPVRLKDGRRVIVPVDYYIERPFQ